MNQNTRLPAPNTSPAIMDSTVRVPLSSGTTCNCCAKKVIPPNRIVASTPRVASVARAFRAAGALKLGTPLLIASTPVSAVQPPAKAVRIRNRFRFCFGSKARTASGCSGRPLTTNSYSPTAIRITRDRMNRYGGTAKALPLSRVPRRLTNPISRIAATFRITRYGSKPGAAAMIAPMPAATETETVST
jgi:hypothetical protein